MMCAAVQKWDVVEETWLFESIEQPVPARQMPPESLAEEVILTAEELHISWRGDSKFFATSSHAAAGAALSPHLRRDGRAPSGCSTSQHQLF